MKISIDIGTGTPIELKAKETAIKILAKQEILILDKLIILSKSTKAVNYLKNNWLTLKMMLGL